MEDLPREHDQLGDFLESPVPQLVEAGDQSGSQTHAGAAPPSGHDELERRVLGDFRIVREIARGGMGKGARQGQGARGQLLTLDTFERVTLAAVTKTVKS